MTDEELKKAARNKPSKIFIEERRSRSTRLQASARVLRESEREALQICVDELEQSWRALAEEVTGSRLLTLEENIFLDKVRATLKKLGVGR